MERLTQEQYPNVPAVVLECLNQMVEIDEREVLVLQNRVTDLCSKLDDAQATVEALQRARDGDVARIGQLCEQVADLERQLRTEEASSRVALDAEREKVATYLKAAQSAHDGHLAAVKYSGELENQLAQLQALVRALPVVEIDGVIVWAAPDESGWFVSKRPAPTGTYWAQFKTQEEAESFLALLRYRATLDATTPARNCPTCDSPAPHLHPAVQHEGEVQPCADQWHKPKGGDGE